MGLFDFLHKKATVPAEHRAKGYVSTTKLQIDANITDFIALDLETTGLNPSTDKIIEVGLVKFSQGQIVDKYSTLIKIGAHIPEAASRVNNITDSMLNSQGKDPVLVYSEVVQFIGNAITGDVVLVAHNAKFDTDFLSNALAEYGYSGKLHYIDTLSVARKLISGLDNYKQPTVARYFGIVNSAEHRAVTDAETCGRIFVELQAIKTTEEKAEKERAKEIAEKTALDDESKEVAAVLLNILERSGKDISKIRFYKNSGNYIDVLWVYNIFKFKLAKKGSYILLPKKFIKDISLRTEPCTKSENDYVNARVFFDSPFELEQIADALVSILNQFVEDNTQYNNLSKYETDFFKEANFTYIPLSDIPGLIEAAKKRDVQRTEKTDLESEKQTKAAEKLANKEVARKLREEEKLQKVKERQLQEEQRLQLQRELLDNADSYTAEQILQIIELSSSQNKRAVIKLDDDNNILKIYISVAEASEDVGIAPKTIRDVANGKYKHGGGFAWRYADEFAEKWDNQSYGGFSQTH